MRDPMVMPPTLYEDTESLLRLFDNLAPDDEARCDEINARVACYGRMARYGAGIEPDGRYTHDWTALRRIAPDGWTFEIAAENGVFICIARAKRRRAVALRSYALPTRLLARLHAFVLAMAYELTRGRHFADEIGIDGRIAPYFR